jgi:hypothetical protein
MWSPRRQKTHKPNKLAKEPFVGMWRNRADMKDSNAWVRNLREREWGKHPNCSNRYGTRHIVCDKKSA